MILASRFTFIFFKKGFKTCTFTQKWLDHLLLMTSYLVTIETHHHWTELKMRAMDERTVTERSARIYSPSQSKFATNFPISFILIFWSRGMTICEAQDNLYSYSLSKSYTFPRNIVRGTMPMNLTRTVPDVCLANLSNHGLYESCLPINSYLSYYNIVREKVKRKQN